MVNPETSPPAGTVLRVTDFLTGLSLLQSIQDSKTKNWSKVPVPIIDGKVELQPGQHYEVRVKPDMRLAQTGLEPLFCHLLHIVVHDEGAEIEGKEQAVPRWRKLATSLLFHVNGYPTDKQKVWLGLDPRHNQQAFGHSFELEYLGHPETSLHALFDQPFSEEVFSLFSQLELAGRPLRVTRKTKEQTIERGVKRTVLVATPVLHRRLYRDRGVDLSGGHYPRRRSQLPNFSYEAEVVLFAELETTVIRKTTAKDWSELRQPRDVSLNVVARDEQGVVRVYKAIGPEFLREQYYTVGDDGLPKLKSRPRPESLKDVLAAMSDLVYQADWPPVDDLNKQIKARESYSQLVEDTYARLAKRLRSKKRTHELKGKKLK